MFFKKIPFSSFQDQRGSLNKFYNNEKFFKVKQVVHLWNPKKFTFRGIHWQTGPFSENKLVYCIKGEIIDVSVDMREKSKTFGKYKLIKLNEKSKFGILIGKGFGHGIFTLKNNTSVIYFSNSKYNKKFSKGLRYDDKKLKLKLPAKPRIISIQDKSW